MEWVAGAGAALRGFVRAAWAQGEKARRRRASPWPALTAMGLAGAVLSLLEYHGDTPHFVELARGWALEDPEWRQIADSRDLALYGKAWWAGARVLLYLVLPMLCVRLVWRRPLRDFGLGLGRSREVRGVTLAAAAIGVVLVLVVSFAPSFQAKYPLYHGAADGLRWLLLWWVLYAMQFVALEFFFRGFWIHALEPAMGAHAVTAMIVPYAMIHFGKPLPETLGALLAGVALGLLALRARSIWPGVIVHVCVGVSMDLAALLQRGAFPTSW